jgi:hypothetical protein
MIARALAPYLGPGMAKAAVEVNRKKLGLEDQELAPIDLDLLLAELAPGLRVFLGDVQTRRVLANIRVKVFPERGYR